MCGHQPSFTTGNYLGQRCRDTGSEQIPGMSAILIITFNLDLPTLLFHLFIPPIKLFFVLILSQTHKPLTPTLSHEMLCFFDCYLFLLTTSQIHFSSFSSDIMLLFHYFLPSHPVLPTYEIISHIFSEGRIHHLCLARGKGGEREV